MNEDIDVHWEIEKALAPVLQKIEQLEKRIKELEPSICNHCGGTGGRRPTGNEKPGDNGPFGPCPACNGGRR